MLSLAEAAAAAPEEEDDEDAPLPPPPPPPPPTEEEEGVIPSNIESTTLQNSSWYLEALPVALLASSDPLTASHTTSSLNGTSMRNVRFPSNPPTS